jgi:hypothetical protein
MLRRIRFYADCGREMKESTSIDLTGRSAPLQAGQEALLLVIAFARHRVYL